MSGILRSGRQTTTYIEIAEKPITLWKDNWNRHLEQRCYPWHPSIFWCPIGYGKYILQLYVLCLNKYFRAESLHEALSSLRLGLPFIASVRLLLLSNTALLSSFKGFKGCRLLLHMRLPTLPFVRAYKGCMSTLQVVPVSNRFAPCRMRLVGIFFSIVFSFFCWTF